MANETLSIQVSTRLKERLVDVARGPYTCVSRGAISATARHALSLGLSLLEARSDEERAEIARSVQPDARHEEA